MDESSVRKPGRYGMLSVAIIAILGGGLGYNMIKQRNNRDSTLNFSIKVPPPDKGWEILPHGPQALFLYSEPKTGLLIRGSVNQMISNVNPTPDLDRDSLAKLMVDNTQANMPGWSAKVTDLVEANNTSFRLVRRSESHHIVVTGFSVKGNTTLLISISGRNKGADEVEKGLPYFKDFLSRVAMVQADSSKW